MKRIISYSLWGNIPRYTQGAIRNVETAADFYPDWECWVYCAKDVSFDIIQKLNRFPNTKVITTLENGDWKFTTKRFIAISEENVERVMFRDCDNRFSEREVKAVEAWIESNKTLHVMKDHPYHGGFPILAGQWGLSNGFKHDMKALLASYKNVEQYHYDQIFLMNYVWKYYGNDSIIHDEIFNNFPFPTERTNFHYIGEPHNEFDMPCTPQHKEILKEFLKNETNKGNRSNR